MTERGSHTTLPSIWTVALGGLVTLFAIIAVKFSAQQSVWTDEATQLSGLSLGFADQLLWLAGRLPHAFSVPIDRTPPLSYWLGSIWMLAFGDAVMTARSLSVCLSVASIFAVWAAARQFLERRTALICAALLALSPNFIVEAAEIRAYAAFIFFSTLLIYCYLKLLAVKPAPSSLDVWAFALVASACSYTHFFGVVISAGAFLSLLSYYLPFHTRTQGLELLRKTKWPLMFYLLSILGLIPFVVAAVNNSAAPHASAVVSFSVRIYELIKLVYRLFSHQSMLGIPGLAVAALLAGLTLIAFGMTRGSNPHCKPLLLYLLVNFVLITLGALVTTAFGAYSTTYNVWALPVVVLLAATALTHVNRSIRTISAVCICVLIASDCYAALRLSNAGDIYAHTRSGVVKNAIDNAGVANAIVVYGNDAASIYFAMIYNYRGSLRQYFASGDSVHLIGSPVGSSSTWICDRDADTLLIADDAELSAEALQFLIAHPGIHTPAYNALDKFLETHHADLDAKWTLVSRNEYLAQTALALAVFKGRTDDLSQDSTKCHDIAG